jgi:hypothetical protein
MVGDPGALRSWMGAPAVQKSLKSSLQPVSVTGKKAPAPLHSQLTLIAQLELTLFIFLTRYSFVSHSRSSW